MPAVSTSTTGTPSKVSSVSTGSRVVPGVGLTRARSSPSRALSSDDLPTFGRPMIASRSGASWSAGFSSAGGSWSTTRSSRSPTPMPCCAETRLGSSKPSSSSSCAKWRSEGVSALFAATITWRPDRLSSPAMSLSSGVRPCRTSSSSTMTCAWSIAIFVWASTIALRCPRTRLNSVDLPTFGRPTMATMGLLTCESDHVQRLGLKRTPVLLGHERVRVYEFAGHHRDDEIDVAGPRALGVETRGLRGVVGMAVVVADDVLAVGVSFALDADVVARVDLVPVPRALDDDVARPFGLRRGARAARADQDAADLVGVALGAMRLDRLERKASDLHRTPLPRSGGRVGWGLPYRPVDR